MKENVKIDEKIEKLFEEIELNEETMASFGALNMLPPVEKAISDFRKAGYYDLDKVFDPVVKYLMKIKKHLERQKKQER